MLWLYVSNVFQAKFSTNEKGILVAFKRSNVFTRRACARPSQFERESFLPRTRGRNFRLSKQMEALRLFENDAGFELRSNYSRKIK